MPRVAAEPSGLYVHGRVISSTSRSHPPDGATALEMLAIGLPDVMVLDLTMPITKGWDVLETLHRQEISDQLCIIVLSAASKLREEAPQLQGFGVRAIIPKPFDPNTVLVTVKVCTCGRAA